MPRTKVCAGVIKFKRKPLVSLITREATHAQQGETYTETNIPTGLKVVEEHVQSVAEEEETKEGVRSSDSGYTSTGTLIQDDDEEEDLYRRENLLETVQQLAQTQVDDDSRNARRLFHATVGLILEPETPEDVLDLYDEPPPDSPVQADVRYYRFIPTSPNETLTDQEAIDASAAEMRGLLDDLKRRMDFCGLDEGVRDRAFVDGVDVEFPDNQRDFPEGDERRWEANLELVEPMKTYQRMRERLECSIQVVTLSLHVYIQSKRMRERQKSEAVAEEEETKEGVRSSDSGYTSTGTLIQDDEEEEDLYRRENLLETALQVAQTQVDDDSRNARRLFHTVVGLILEPETPEEVLDLYDEPPPDRPVQADAKYYRFTPTSPHIPTDQLAIDASIADMRGLLDELERRMDLCGLDEKHGRAFVDGVDVEFADNQTIFPPGDERGRRWEANLKLVEPMKTYRRMRERLECCIQLVTLSLHDFHVHKNFAAEDTFLFVEEQGHARKKRRIFF